MAAHVFDLMASLAMDTSQFDRGMAESQSKISKFSSGLSSIGSGLTSVGNSLTNKITKPAMVAGGALAGITLAKGWSRMTEIDNAKVKLEAIGLSAKEVSSVTDASLASVKGTAYGMAEAMTTAASATAAGVDPATDLQQYLTDVADAAAVAGIGMDEMGGIFNKVATQGKAGNDTLQQMAERGIPIYQWLADETGHTAEEIFDMASKGEIDLATFQSAVENHIGGAAKEMGSKTITGAISNISAAISRVGASFLGSADDSSTFAGRILDVLNDVTGFIDSIEPKVAAVGEVFGQVFGAVYEYLKNGTVSLETFAGMGDTARAVFEKMQPIIDVVKNIVTWFMEMSTQGKLAFAGIAIGIGPALSIIGKLLTTAGGLFTSFSQLSGVVAKLPGGFTKFLGPIGLAISAFVLLFTQSEEFRNAIMTLISSLMSAFQPVIAAMIPLISQVGGLLGDVAEIIGPILAAAIKLITPLIVAWGKVFGKVVKTIFSAMTKIVSAFRKPINAAKSVKTTIANAFSEAKEKAVESMQKLKDGVEKKITAAKDKVKDVVDKIKGFFPFSVGKIFSGWIPKISLKTKKEGDKASTSSSVGKTKFAKAVNQPYLFTRPTVFNQDIAGETADEMLYGKSALMADIRQAVKKEQTQSEGNIIINLTYNAGDDANEMVKDIARGVKRYRMAGAF